MMQDSIDFGTMNIPKLFRMMFIPTLLGMVLSATKYRRWNIRRKRRRK